MPDGQARSFVGVLCCCIQVLKCWGECANDLLLESYEFRGKGVKIVKEMSIGQNWV